MKASKWYLVQGQRDTGNYAIIKEEDTDLIVAEFEPVNHDWANRRIVDLSVIISEHNYVVNLLKKNK